MFGDVGQNRIERSDAERGVRWYGYAVLNRLLCLQDHVTSHSQNLIANQP
jgi:hypothetical protein